jgi:kanamycin kinase
VGDVIAGVPPAGVEVPAAVAAVAAGRPTRAVWRNQLGGLTFELGGPARTFVKFAPAGSGLPLARESERLRWAAPFTSVPRALGEGADGAGRWLHTAALPGTTAVAPRWIAAPRRAVVGIARGLRAMHDALPVAACPFGWGVPERLAPLADPAAVGEPPPIDRLVVCHGDPCAPNTLLDDEGGWTGHVDLAALGVADRWADLAVASESLTWNYGPGWDATFFAAYGVAPDPARIAFYRRLWHAAP